MEVLGHSDIRLTMNLYTHVAQDLKRDASDRMESHVYPVAVKSSLVPAVPTSHESRPLGEVTDGTAFVGEWVDPAFRVAGWVRSLAHWVASSMASRGG